ncbi:MAG TPA: FGGY family carbohydrate kinase [Candidatus Limnocylindrales bacterium]|nr:FGGY family carbohydrate kinase [Candidatus Limnocylindrales bacterium]
MSASDRWDEAIVTLDVGTSGAHAAAFDVDGRRRIEVRRSYPTMSPRPGWAEQDANAWRTASLSALRALVAEIGGNRRVRAIGLTGQCPSIVVLDSARRPLLPALIYRDNRAVAEAASLRRVLGEARAHERTGHLPAAFHVLPKLAWLRRHERATFDRAALAVQPRDWLALVLTGEARTDGTHAAATLAYDLGRRAWAADLAGAAGIDVALFPPLGGSADVVGTLRPVVAARLGLPAATPVVLGGADSQACALGAGVVAEGPVSEMAGSSTCLNAVVAHVLPTLGVTHYPHVVGSKLTTETGINTSGAAVGWVASLVYAGRTRRATPADFARLDAEAACVPAGSNGVVALAVFGDGERTAPDLRAAFTGLALTDNRAVLARAVLEGVAFAIRSQLELLASAGAPPTELRISGGDTRFATWNRIKADVTGLPVRVVRGDAAAAGVAMLAGIGTGIYTSPDEAIRCCVRFEPSIEPDPDVARRYTDAHAAWRELAASRVVVRRAGR